MPPDMPAPPAKPVAQGLLDCGLQQQGFTVAYNRDLQGQAITISARAGADRAKLQCIWDAAWTEFVRFEQADLQAAYDAISEARFAPLAKQSARDSLAKLGLLKGLLIRNDFSSLADFAVAIERHCGLSPNEALRIDGEWITLFPNPEMAPAHFDKIGCLFSALTAAGVTKIGLIGNAAAARSDND